GIAYDTTLWTECLRVLKPGGHLIAFGGTRTYHRMTVAIEDAGFEIRDSVIWMYGSGFPKSLDVSKAIDKVTGTQSQGFVSAGHDGRKSEMKQNLQFRSDYGYKYQPTTPEAQQWHGYGTALKPAHEPAVLARKPLTGTVADNVLTWGTGALNIDGSRVGGDTGRWPANVILDEHAAEALDEQSGHSVSSASANRNGQNVQGITGIMAPRKTAQVRGHTDSGGASRFFYIAKASKAEREAGLEGMEVKQAGSMRGNTDYKPRLSGDGKPIIEPMRANHHPTVKPIALMRHLVRLVTPKGGTVLDPFMGSGSTGCAAMLEGMRFVGIDITAEYVDIAERRIQHYLNQNPMEL
ncbi:MAG: DNA-methyltransferase, partial [Bacteroidota bacterium]